jgi:hypothetical protein
VVSHVAVLMGFAGIMIRYVNSCVMSVHLETTAAEPSTIIIELGCP